MERQIRMRSQMEFKQKLVIEKFELLKQFSPKKHRNTKSVQNFVRPRIKTFSEDFMRRADYKATSTNPSDQLKLSRVTFHNASSSSGVRTSLEQVPSEQSKFDRQQVKNLIQKCNYLKYQTISQKKDLGRSISIFSKHFKRFLNCTGAF